MGVLRVHMAAFSCRAFMELFLMSCTKDSPTVFFGEIGWTATVKSGSRGERRCLVPEKGK